MDNPATKKKGKAAAAMRDSDLEGSPATEPRMKSSNSSVATPQEGQQLQSKQTRQLEDGEILDTSTKKNTW